MDGWMRFLGHPLYPPRPPGTGSRPAAAPCGMRPPRRSIDARCSAGAAAASRGWLPISVGLLGASCMPEQFRKGTCCPDEERGCGIWSVGSGGGCAGWEACQGMCGVFEGKGEECILAPGGYVGLVWFARRSWGRWDAVSVLEKKRENSFSIARSEALFSVVLDPFPEKQNSCTRSCSGHLTKQTFSTGKEFEHSVHCRRINAEGSLTSF